MPGSIGSGHVCKKGAGECLSVSWLHKCPAQRDYPTTRGLNSAYRQRIVILTLDKGRSTIPIVRDALPIIKQ